MYGPEHFKLAEQVVDDIRQEITDREAFESSVTFLNSDDSDEIIDRLETEKAKYLEDFSVIMPVYYKNDFNSMPSYIDLEQRLLNNTQ